MVQDSQLQSFASPEEEIRHLEQKLEQKKQELSEKGGALPPEKEVFREVLRSHIEEVRQTPALNVPAPAITPPLSTGSGAKPSLLQKQSEREKDLRALLEIALTRNIEQAVKIAQGESPYLLDELHDHLIDDYYQKLIELRKIKAL